MAEETVFSPSFDPGRCILANGWHYRVVYLERKYCPFGACVFLDPARIPRVRSRTESILSAIYQYGCREWRDYAALDNAP
jgi:hypothetical protein